MVSLAARWPDAGPALNRRMQGDEAVGKPWKRSQGFKPDLGKPAVRDYRGASGNVALGKRARVLSQLPVGGVLSFENEDSGADQALFEGRQY